MGMIKEEFDALYFKYNPIQDQNEMWNFINDKLNVLKPKVVLEIGTEFGGSSLIWASVAKENNGLFIGVDCETNRAKSVIESCLLGFSSYWCTGISQDLVLVEQVKELLDGLHSKVDFLFIDGSHEINDVYLDCKNFVPLVKSGGIVAFHDSSDKNGGPYLGMVKARNEGIIDFLDDDIYNVRMGIRWFVKK